MNKSNKFLLKVGGNESFFELEHRIFNISSFLITILATVGVFGNYFTGLHFMTVGLSFIGAVISGYIWYLARIKNVFTLKVIFIYLVNIFFVLGIMFFFNAGTQGAVLYLIIMLLNIFLLIVPSTYQYFVGIVLYLTVILLIAIEFFFPRWVLPYHSTNEMLLDHVITISYTVFFTTAIIVLFRNKHLEDRQKILSQNESLLALNQQINSQKNELEEKTKQLQLSIESTNERNKYIETLFKRVKS